jgi:predicted metal-dependent hydrolase
VSVITAIATIITVIINTKASNKEIQHKIETQQAVFETKLESLTTEVREHNNYARRMPVVEEQIRVINHRLTDLERKNENP